MSAPDDRPPEISIKDDVQPNIELLRLQFERERWQAELALQQREQNNRDEEIKLKREEQAASKWRSPLVVAILAAAIAGLGNAAVTGLNGYFQRDLESRKRDAERVLEENKAESTRILEMIKTGNTETAAQNIAFLLETGLVAEDDRAAKLRKFLAIRQPGTGPSLPTAARIAFEPGALMTQSFQADLQATLGKYIEYLERMGFPPKSKTVVIRVDDELHGNTYYSDQNEEIRIGADVMTDVTGPLQQYGVSVLFNLKRDESNEEMLGLEFGLADYLTASFLQNPRIGEVFAKVAKSPKSYLRTMENERKFTEAKASQDHLETAEIWGGLFWELRQRITRERLEPILARAWQAAPSTPLSASVFVNAMLASIPDDEVSLRRDVQDVLRKREFPAGK
jgi:hypothetical protein